MLCTPCTMCKASLNRYTLKPDSPTADCLNEMGTVNTAYAAEHFFLRLPAAPDLPPHLLVQKKAEAKGGNQQSLNIYSAAQEFFALLCPLNQGFHRIRLSAQRYFTVHYFDMSQHEAQHQRHSCATRQWVPAVSLPSYSLTCPSEVTNRLLSEDGGNVLSHLMAVRH